MPLASDLLKAEEVIKAHEDKLAELTKSLESQVEAVALVTKERDQFKADLVKEQEAVKAEQAKVQATVESLEAEKKQHEATKVELETARKALANPAFAAAAAQGSKTAVEEGGTEAKATMTYNEAIAMYKKISDPKERAQFREDHAKELKLK